MIDVENLLSTDNYTKIFTTRKQVSDIFVDSEKKILDKTRFGFSITS